MSTSSCNLELTFWPCSVHCILDIWSSDIRSNLLYGQFLVGPICYLTFYRNYLILGLIAYMVNVLWTKPQTIYPICIELLFTDPPHGFSRNLFFQAQGRLLFGITANPTGLRASHSLPYFIFLFFPEAYLPASHAESSSFLSGDGSKLSVQTESAPWRNGR